MNAEKKVTISFKGRSAAAPPIKFEKARNGRPSQSKFLFFPKCFNNLKDYVRYVKWDAHDKKLFTEIYETPKFEVYKWIEYMSKQSHDIQISPFVDVDTNICTLIFADHEGTPITTARFKNLTVIYHSCVLETDDYDTGEGLAHELQLQYDSVEVVVHWDNEINQSDEDENDHEKDREWQTVELPA
jgi:hypothetical protein